MNIHPNITVEVVEEACMESLVGTGNPGYCIKCGEENMSVDPDSTQQECEFCHERTVYGPLELAYILT